MLEELKVIVDELRENRHDAKVMADSYRNCDANFYVVDKYNAKVDAYDDAIKLLNDFIDKHEGVSAISDFYSANIDIP